MSKNILAVILAAGLVVALPSASVLAEAAAKEKTMTPQLKMKECAVKWREEKTKTGTKGRAAYNDFMRGCLRKSPA